MITADILVSYDVNVSFTSVPIDETTNYIVEKAFASNWFNEVYSIDLSRKQLIELIEIATKDQLFLFDGDYSNRSTKVPSPFSWDISWLMLCCAQ